MKKTMTTLVALGLMGAMMVGGTASAEEGLKIGISIQTLGNQVWAQQMAGIQELAEADGNECIV